MATRTVPTPRGQERRERILNAAADLFAANGFHRVGVIEIGAAAGVTGAALYRHFASKTDVLVALFERFIDGLLEVAEAATRGDQDPNTALMTLIAAHADFALRDRSILAVYGQEAHNLPADDRRRLRRKQRHYAEVWRSLLCAEHPDVPADRALIRVEAVFGLLNSVPHLSKVVPDEVLRSELSALSAAALDV